MDLVLRTLDIKAFVTEPSQLANTIVVSLCKKAIGGGVLIPMNMVNG